LIESQPILLVEDNEDDARLTARAFSQAEIANPLVHVGDGVEALDYLFCRGRYEGRDVRMLPVMVLVDLQLPRLAGLDVVKAIRGCDHTRYLPVVVLTSSDQDRDRLAAYNHQVNSYVQKPVGYDQFVDAARHLGRYWIRVNMVPPPPPPREPVPR
jgi:two-component system response regulator